MSRNPNSWKTKVHPAFLDFAAIYRRACEDERSADSPGSAKSIQTIRDSARREIEEIRRKYPDLPIALSPYQTVHVSGPSMWPPSPSDYSRGFMERLFWNRYREPLWVAVQKAEGGDLKAQRRINRILEDYQRIRSGRGPLKPFKADMRHIALLEMGLALGLDKLSPDELADCFDAVCACGKEHSADALKKQRARLKKAIQAARAWEWSAVPQRERLMVYGRNGIAAKAFQSPDGKIRRVYVLNLGNPPEMLHQQVWRPSRDQRF